MTGSTKVSQVTTTHPAPPAEEVARLVRGEHHDPHAILGAHPIDGGTAIRAFHPDANGAWLVAPNGGSATMDGIGDGLWSGLVPDLQPGQFSYRVRFGFPDGNTWELDDPYRFAPTLGEVDLHLIAEGTHERLYDVLGAHPRTHQGISGVSFAVWAPNARSVRIVGDFDRWDGRLMPMRSMGASGVWELFVPGIGTGELYKFEILGADGKLRLKADPFAFAMQVRPETASRVWDPSVYRWTDDDWMRRRAETDPYRSPMAAYEVHLGSWMRNPDGSWLGYRQAAEELVTHCRAFGFTHVELLPIAEHPFDGSWGYQVTGYYAPTARFGNPDDFAAFVDTLHNAGIGVILDWVPAHFPTDDFALRRFDGTPLYEHADPHRGEHPDWGTLIFDFGRSEVRNFLVANALFWCDRYHVDRLTFLGRYVGTEQFVLPLSHDEVVHGKGSLLRKMPGDEWQRFANLRVLLLNMWAQPGKKLLFMGSEIGPWDEWSHDRALAWQLLDVPSHAGVARFVEDLGRVYLGSPALWAADHEPDGFAWIDAADVESSVYSWMRRGGGEVCVAVLNLTPVPRLEYRLGLPMGGRWVEVLNSDSEHYGGSNLGNLGGVVALEEPWHGQPFSASLLLPPLSGLILRPAG